MKRKVRKKIELQRKKREKFMRRREAIMANDDAMFAESMFFVSTLLNRCEK